MKRILKEGTVLYIKRFECRHCGCIFESDEYTKEYTDKDGSKLNICHWIIEKCPYCKKTVIQLEAD